ncbi:hypothetical protein [Deinococcus sp. AJ005]|uniref:hypothetical protein n=1 Tax=Deinococcus sp. AJ005 TaxID=2652443 RepID=UPI00125CCD07|nr:hypothetical protein [Deinococcus sp. AJ005]QFP77007.1 hypothetical protein DAAJ005_11510 [Deinococcus sp. AJ005]
MSRLLPRIRTLFLVLPALLLGACGTSTTPNLPPGVTPAATTLTFALSIPTPVGGQGLRTQYVSSATTSLRVRVGSLDTTLALGAAVCTTGAGGQTCTLSLKVDPGANQVLTVDAYDGGSHLLSTSTSTVTVVAHQDNPVRVTMSGVALSATLQPTDRAADLTTDSTGHLLLDSGGLYKLGIALKDAAGQTILNPGRPTETVTSSNPAFNVQATGVGTFTVEAPQPTGRPQVTTLTVKGAAGTVLATQVLTVPAHTVTVALSNAAPVAGSSIVATAQLSSARGRPLPIGSRVVSFSTGAGSGAGAPLTSTDATGRASMSLLTEKTVGARVPVNATADGVTGTVTYTSVTGTANTTTSTVTLSANPVRVNGSSTLTVTLRDGFNNPVTTVPAVSVTGQTTFTFLSQQSNVFTYAVHAAAAPETATFTVVSQGNTVGTARLAVTASLMAVTHNGTALISGVSQYDFENDVPQVFTVSESSVDGFFAESSNPSVAMASVGGSTLTVTPQGPAGFSTITVQDSFGQTFTFTVSVTTAAIIID